MNYDNALRWTALVIVVLLVAVTALVSLLLLNHTGLSFWQDVIKDHFMATIGLPAASVSSFGAVIFLRQTEGPIEFEALGFKLKGAAGQVTLWAFGVVILSLCGKLLW